MSKEDKISDNSPCNWVNDVLTDEEYEEQSKTNVLPNGSVVEYADKYKKEYDHIAFSILQQSGATIASLCSALQVSNPTLNSWRKRHKSFDEAIKNSRLCSKAAFIHEIHEIARSDTPKPNRGLYTNLASWVHGLRPDSTTEINISNNVKLRHETSELYEKLIERENHG